MSDILAGGFLKGKKTYVTSVTGIIGAIAAYLIGEISLVESFQVIWPLAAVFFLRKGLENATTDSDA